MFTFIWSLTRPCAKWTNLSGSHVNVIIISSHGLHLHSKIPLGWRKSCYERDLGRMKVCLEESITNKKEEKKIATVSWVLLQQMWGIAQVIEK